MKDLGELTHYLGLEIERNGTDSIKVHQQTYAKKLQTKYQKYLGQSDMRAFVPMNRDLKLTHHERMTADQRKFVGHFPYQEMLGSLMYLAVNTRPDI